MVSDLPIGQYPGVDGTGEWDLMVTNSGVWAYGLHIVGRKGPCAISAENVIESVGALLRLHGWYEAHPLSDTERCQREWRAHLRAMPWWKRWAVKVWMSL